MGTDSPIKGITTELLTTLGLDIFRCMRDELLVMGVKKTFKHLATPDTEATPMDHPTEGIVLVAGKEANDAGFPIEPGFLVYFPKFSAQEINSNNKRFFVVSASKIVGYKILPKEEIDKLATNSY